MKDKQTNITFHVVNKNHQQKNHRFIKSFISFFSINLLALIIWKLPTCFPSSASLACPLSRFIYSVCLCEPCNRMVVYACVFKIRLTFLHLIGSGLWLSMPFFFLSKLYRYRLFFRLKTYQKPATTTKTLSLSVFVFVLSLCSALSKGHKNEWNIQINYNLNQPVSVFIMNVKNVNMVCYLWELATFAPWELDGILFCVKYVGCPTHSIWNLQKQFNMCKLVKIWSKETTLRRDPILLWGDLSR